MSEPSKYEQSGVREIQQWKHRHERGWRKIARVVSWPIDKAGDLVMVTPGLGWVIEKSVSGVVSLVNEASQWSVRPEAIFAEYRASGDDVRGPDDVRNLDLRAVDRTIGALRAKYIALAAAEGSAFGAMGLPGIPLDIAALTALALRAVGEYATYCGFDVQLQHERTYAVQVLGYGSADKTAAKSAAMAELAKVARAAASKKTWAELQKQASVQVMQRIARALGIRLTKAKLAQIAPVVGAGVAAGFNSYFVGNVCEASYFLYRERFLAEKYGASMIGD